MQIIQYGSAFNPANAFVDDVYEQVIPPQSYFQGAPTSIAFVEGTASWGQLNNPVLLSNPAGLQATYGSVSATALTDIHDLATDVTQALNQAQGGTGLSVYASRVSDGTDTQAQAILYDGTTVTVTFTDSSFTSGDVVTILFTSPALSGGFYNLQYTLVSGDTTPTLLATHVKAAINDNATLTAAGFAATSASGVVSITWTTPSVTFAVNINGTTIATIGGSVSTGDMVTVTVHNTGLSGGLKAETYTVLDTDESTADIATGLAGVINADSALTALGITATTSTDEVLIASTSVYLTTYTKTNGADATVTLSGGPTETATLGGSTAGITILGKWTGILGNQIAIITQAGSATGTVTAIVSPFPGGGSPEIYQNLPGTGSTFWTALQNALNTGLSPTRGPSNFVVATGATTTSAPPVFPATVPLAGGSDGRDVSSADLVGSNNYPATGIYVAANTQFAPSVAWIAGLTDSTVYSTIQAFADQNNIMFWFTFAQGLTTADAVTAKQGYGILDYQIGFLKDWVYIFDQANSVTRLIPPFATGCGSIAALPPWISPSNKTVANIIGTERNNPFTGNVPYSTAELAELQQAGIMVITKPIPAGGVFGFRDGCNSIGNRQINAPVEYTRLINFIVETNAQILGPYIGQNQGFTTSDSTRASVRNELNAFFSGLATSNSIGAFNVTCDLTNNSQTSIAQHVLQINESIQFLPSILVIFVQTQGGTSVNAVNNATGQTLVNSNLG